MTCVPIAWIAFEFAFTQPTLYPCQKNISPPCTPVNLIVVKYSTPELTNSPPCTPVKHNISPSCTPIKPCTPVKRQLLVNSAAEYFTTIALNCYNIISYLAQGNSRNKQRTNIKLKVQGKYVTIYKAKYQNSLRVFNSHEFR